MTTKTPKFELYFEKKRKKPEFATKINGESMTDQSDHSRACIREMAKKYGLEVLEDLAMKSKVDDSISAQFWGYDLTKYSNVEQTLEIKKKLKNMFENVPANIRKEVYKDNVMNFVNSFDINNADGMNTLNKIGLISDNQYQTVIEHNKKQAEIKKENETKANFVKELEKVQGGLYEKFKETGSINFNNSNMSTINNKDN